MEKNGIIDFEKVFNLEITTFKGQVFSRKRVKTESGDVNFEFSGYQCKFYPVFKTEGMILIVNYKGEEYEFRPEDDSTFENLMSNDADALKKAINKVYQGCKKYVGIEKYGVNYK